MTRIASPFDGPYPGAKEAIWRFIAGVTPWRSLHVEPFWGSATLARYLPLAPQGAIGIDRDPAVIAAWRRTPLPPEWRLTLVRGDGIAWLARAADAGKLPADALVYADPPYLRSTRSRHRLYRFELDEADHRRLLEVLLRLPCHVMVSGYPSRLYDRELRGWVRIEIPTMTRGGRRVECLWLNYDPDQVRLVDVASAGAGWRDRQRIARLVERWAANFRGRKPHERQAILGRLMGEAVGRGIG